MIRVSDPSSEGIYQASKWLKVPVLCDTDELRELIDGSFSIVPLTGIFDGNPMSIDYFLSVYAEWIEGLQQGRAPKDSELRKILACVWTEDLDSLWLQKVGEKGYLAKMARPVVQVQAHFFSYSEIDKTFRSMSMGPESIFWGIQCCFPQLFQDPKTTDISEAGKNPLFEGIRRWAKEKTRPTPFIVDGKKENVPIRLGKNCFSWIHRHPQLIEQRIEVVT